ncbi:MAG: NADPH-dependent F420 reductase [Candidatus Bathyarchaeota archaeon]|nr:MAG: NADPH-dependent F420 reductase [Candidatus Bathyarchaeota archaeon]
MKIGLLGGTGNMGRGLTIRWALKHEILVGSRNLDKASRIAKGLSNLARGFYQSEMGGIITGVLNEDAVKESEVIVVTLPPKATVPVLSSLNANLRPSQIVISTVVPMMRKKELFYYSSLDPEGTKRDEMSAAERIQEIVGPSPVVSAFQTVPATYLSNIDAILNIDVLIAGNDELSINIVSRLVRDIPNLRPLRVGPLENSKWIESFTPLLINAAILNGLHDPSIRIVPWMPTSDEL